MPKRLISCDYKAFCLNSNCSDHIQEQWQNAITGQTEKNIWTTVIKNILSSLSCNADKKKILPGLYCTSLFQQA